MRKDTGQVCGDGAFYFVKKTGPIFALKKKSRPVKICIRRLKIILSVSGGGAIRRRLFDMGVTPGADVVLRKKAPLGDPLEITIRGYELTLRKAEAACVEMESMRKEAANGIC